MKIKILLCCFLALAACANEPDRQVDDATPSTESQMIWPQLETVEPSAAAIGEEIVIVGNGGYLQFESEAGIGYNESYRTFQLYLDGEEIGELKCFVNRCEGEIIIPSGLDPGEYELSVEGGSSIIINVAES